MAKSKRSAYLNFSFGISKSELEEHLERKLTGKEWQEAKDTLDDYIDWDRLDDELARAIKEWNSDGEREDD